MARPRKQVVDYFPHDTDASEGKTLTIIQNKFGNDGYAFWFKLLQLLGRTKGHYYNFNELADWEFLLAKTHIKKAETAKNILKTLAALGAIDQELYNHKIIWSQNFLDRIADVYERREDPLPQKPDWKVIESGKAVFENENTAQVNNKPQRRGKETKLKKTKGEGRGLEPTTSPAGSQTLKILLEKFPYAFGREPNSREIAQLRDFAAEVEEAGGATEKQIHDAFKEASIHNKKSVRYVRAVLLDWLGVER